LEEHALESVHLFIHLRNAVSVDCNIRNILSYWALRGVTSDVPSQGIVGPDYLQRAAERLDQADRLAVLGNVVALLSPAERMAFAFHDRTAAQLRAASAACLRHVRNSKRSMHRELVAFLFRRWDVIVWPKLNVKEIVRRSKRAYGPKMARLLLLAIGHGELLRYAKYYATRCRGKTVLSDEDGVSEMFSTLTCSSCGHRGPRFAHERFECESCNLDAHRDLNAAKNVFLFNLHLIIAAVSATMVAQQGAARSSSGDTSMQPVHDSVAAVGADVIGTAAHPDAKDPAGRSTTHADVESV